MVFKQILNNWPTTSIYWWFKYIHHQIIDCAINFIKTTFSLLWSISLENTSIFYCVAFYITMILFYLFIFEFSIRLLFYLLTPYNISVLIVITMWFFHYKNLVEYDLWFFLYNRNRKYFVPEYVYIARTILLVSLVTMFSKTYLFSTKQSTIIFLYCNLIFLFMSIFFDLKCLFFFLLKRMLFKLKRVLYKYFNFFLEKLNNFFKKTYENYKRYFVFLNELVWYKTYLYLLNCWLFRWSTSKINTLNWKNPSNPFFLINFVWFTINLLKIFFLKNVTFSINTTITLLLVFFYFKFMVNFYFSNLILLLFFQPLLFFFSFYVWSFLLYICTKTFLKIIWLIKSNFLMTILCFCVLVFILYIDIEGVDLFLIKKISKLHRHRTSYTWFMSGAIQYGYDTTNTNYTGFVVYEIHQIPFFIFSKFIQFCTFIFFFLKKIFFRFNVMCNGFFEKFLDSLDTSVWLTFDF